MQFGYPHLEIRIKTIEHNVTDVEPNVPYPLDQYTSPWIQKILNVENFCSPHLIYYSSEYYLCCEIE